MSDGRPPKEVRYTAFLLDEDSRVSLLAWTSEVGHVVPPRRRPSVRSDAAPHADRRGDGRPARRRVRARTGRLWEQHAPRAARRAVPPAHPAANKKRNDHFCPLELAPYFPEKNTRVTNWYPFQL